MPVRTLVKVPLASEEPLRFPLFAESRATGMVVLFTDDLCGTVIHEGANPYEPIGQVGQFGPIISDRWKVLPDGSSVTLTIDRAVASSSAKPPWGISASAEVIKGRRSKVELVKAWDAWRHALDEDRPQQFAEDNAWERVVALFDGLRSEVGGT